LLLCNRLRYITRLATIVLSTFTTLDFSGIAFMHFFVYSGAYLLVLLLVLVLVLEKVFLHIFPMLFNLFFYVFVSCELVDLNKVYRAVETGSIGIYTSKSNRLFFLIFKIAFGLSQSNRRIFILF